jgi:hypothetical protein
VNGDDRRKADRSMSIAIFVVTAALYGSFFGGGGWNQNAHFDLVRAIVERQTIAIDGLHTNTGDFSIAGDHVYANKAPGISFAGVIPYAIIYAVERAAGIDPRVPAVFTVNAWLTTFAVCGLAGALIPMLLYRYGREIAGVSPLRAASVALAIALATPLFPFSTVLFLHVPSAAALLASLWFVLRGRPALAGAAAGFAGLANYVAIPVAGVLWLLAIATSRRRGRDGLLFAAAAAPFAAALALYQKVAFGGWLTTPMDTMSPIYMTEGAVLGIISLPTMEALYGITFSPYRGIFFAAPLLLAALAGAAVMVRGPRRNLALIMTAVFLWFILFTASFNGWHGGGTYTARYLIPAIPLLGLLLMEAPRKLRAVWIVLAVVSFANSFAVTVVDPTPPETVRSPLTEYVYPLLATGRPSPSAVIPREAAPQFIRGHSSVNRQTFAELYPATRFGGDAREGDWASFNAGEVVFGPGSAGSAVFMFLVIVAAAGWLLLRARRLSVVSR